MPLTQHSAGQTYITVENEQGPMDLTGSTVFIIIKKATGDIEKIECVPVDEATGKFLAPLTEHNLSDAGTYEFQLKIQSSTGALSRSKMGSFYVDGSLTDPDEA